MKLGILNTETRAFDQRLRAAMHCQRTELFIERLGWTGLTVIDGQEHDISDADPDVTYLVTWDEAGLVGACRLVPLAGRSLLTGPLASYLGTPAAANSLAWELTRFAPATDPKDKRHGRSFAFLAAGVIAWALERDIKQVFGIAEPPLMGIAASLGWRVQIEGPPMEFLPGQHAFAFSFPVDAETLASTLKALRIDALEFAPIPQAVEVAV